MKRWLKVFMGDAAFKWFISNLPLVGYVFVLLTFLVVNSFSGIRKSKRVRILEEENTKLRWEYLQMKADYTKSKSRKAVVPKDYSDYVTIPKVIISK